MWDIIGHPDDGRFPVDMKRLVKKQKKPRTLLEVNIHHCVRKDFERIQRELSGDGKGM